MQIHASCAARDDAGVLLLGPPGSGKSDMVLRLLDRGFALVADDIVEIEAGMARSPDRLSGLLEVRGLGIMRLPHRAAARLALAVRLGAGERLPEPEAVFGLPAVSIDPRYASAPARVGLALDCALGRVTQLVGAFA